VSAKAKKDCAPLRAKAVFSPDRNDPGKSILRRSTAARLTIFMQDIY